MNAYKGYVDAVYLQAVARSLQPIKERSYEMLRAHPGQTLLDVGCGPGIDTVALGRRVAPTGRVFGIDADESMLKTADERAAQSGLSHVVNHRLGSATELPWASEQFDGCRSERLFIHLAEPRRALAEMVRVTRVGGWVVLIDTDWGSYSLDHVDTMTERQLARCRAEHVLRNGYSGRRLYGLCREHGLRDLTVEVLSLHTTDPRQARYLGQMDEVEAAAVGRGLVSPDDMQHWHVEMERSDRAGTFFASVNMVLVAGRKAAA